MSAWVISPQAKAMDAVRTICPPMVIQPVIQAMNFLPRTGYNAVTQWYCPAVKVRGYCFRDCSFVIGNSPPAVG